jgi:hypothetical protein
MALLPLRIIIAEIAEPPAPRLAFSRLRSQQPFPPLLRGPQRLRSALLQLCSGRGHVPGACPV